VGTALLRLLTLASFCLFTLLPSAGSAPQKPGERWFQMLDDLDGFAARYLSDYSTVYDFTPFEKKSKSWISQDEWTRLQELWEREKARAAVEIARIKSDPVARSKFLVRRNILKNGYFSEVDFQFDDSAMPLYFVIQRPKKDSQAYYDRIVAYYRPWAEQILEVFDEEYAKPLELTLRDDRRVFGLAVLPTQGDYNNYANRMKDRGLYWARAHYDPAMRVAVTYEPGAGSSPEERRHALMHELVHELVDAYSLHSGAANLPRPWIGEGFAEYLSSGTQAGKPESVRAHALDTKARDQIATVLRTPGVRDAYFLPLVDMLFTSSYRDLKLRVYKRCQAQGVGFMGDLALNNFYRQSYLLVYFLQHGKSGAYRDRFNDYLKACLAGDSSKRVFRKAFEGVDLDELQAEFIAWVEPTAKNWTPPVMKADITAIAGGAGAPDAEAEPTYDPAGLRPDLDDPDVALSLAVCEAREGKAREALARLGSIDVSKADADLQLRIATEKERLQSWIDVQRRFLEHLQVTGKKLVIDHEGQPLRAEVLGIEEGAVRLGENRLKVDSLPLEELDPLELAQLMSKTKDLEESRARIYMYVLWDDPHWPKLLRTESSKDEALRLDAEKDYPNRLEKGEIVVRLLEAADLPLPEDAKAARHTLERIEVLLASDRTGSSVLIEKARPVLADLAEIAHLQILGESSLEGLLGAEVTDLGQGKVRLSYSFKKAAELEDFEYSRYLPGLYTAPGRDGNPFSVTAGGALQARGQGCLRSSYALTGPITVRYKLGYRDVESTFEFRLGICDDGYESYLAAFDLFSLFWSETKMSTSADLASAPGRHVVKIGDTTYSMELRYDAAGTAQLLCNGQQMTTLSGCPRKEGAVFLWVDIDGRIEVDDLVIEGTLRDDFLRGLRLKKAKELADAYR